MSLYKKVLLFLLVFFIPSNLSYHFGTTSSLVSGITVDYLIPKLYLTDIFILLLIIPWALRHLRSKIYDLKSPIFWFFLWTLFQSLFLASNQVAAIWLWLKLLEMGLFTWYLSRQLITNHYSLITPLSLSVIFQSLLAWGQWLLQRNIFPYYLLGESQYSLATAAIDKISWFGMLKVPPLGTTPHPNVLAGFLAISLTILISRKKYLTTLIGFPALLLTHSLSGIFAFFFGLALLSRRKLFLVPLLLATSYLLLATVSSPSFIRRVKLNDIAFTIIKSRPLGIGLNNFTYVMPKYGEVEATYRFLQPVHNIYLLLWSETGLIGILLVTLIVVKKLGQLEIRSIRNFASILMVLFIGAADHYPLTLQVGQLLLVLALSLPLPRHTSKASRLPPTRATYPYGYF